MPTISTTREFIDTLFVESDKDENTSDLIYFIKKEVFDITLVCDFSSINEYKIALTENPLWELLLDKYDKIKFNPNLETDIFEESFYEKLDEQNLFLVSLNESQCEKLSKERGYIYVSSGNISKTWQTIKSIRDNSVYKVTTDNNFPDKIKFDCWSKLDNMLLPLTSIIIFDRYILTDKSNQKLEDNLFKIIMRLCKNNNLLKPVTLTIISEFQTDTQITSSHYKIMNFFNRNSISNIKLNIIRHDKNKYPSDFEGLHYRLLVTNNIRIKCDDSFNFFKSNGKVNNDADLHITFNLSHPQKCFFEKELKHIKRYISKINNLPEETNLTDKIYFYQDKENYLFY